MKTIHIHYAYDGFLYAPLFLAKHLGLLPENFALTPAATDKKAIEGICKPSSPTHKNWFAICDPSAAVERSDHSNDYLRIVGTLINKPALWAYHPADIVMPVEKETELETLRGNSIKKIVCYEKGTTGYVFGKRLQKKIGLSEDMLYPIAFDAESTQRDELLKDNTTLLLTADVFYLVKNAILPSKRNIILSYPHIRDPLNLRSPHPDLGQFLFTAVVTLEKEVIDRNAWAVLTLLNALTGAISLLRSEQLLPEVQTALVTHFQPHLNSLGVSTPEEANHLVEEAVRFLYNPHRECISPDVLYPTKASALNTLEIWLQDDNHNGTDIETLIDEGPCLLTKEDWRYSGELHGYLVQHFPGIRQVLLRKTIPLRYKYALGLIILCAMVLLPITIYKVINGVFYDTTFPLTPNKPTALVILLLGYSLLIWVIYYCLQKLKKVELDSYFDVSVSAVGISLTLMLGSLFVL